MPIYRILVCDDDSVWRSTVTDEMPGLWEKLFSEKIIIDVCSNLVSSGATRPVMSFAELQNYDALVLDLFWENFDQRGEPGRHGITICQETRSQYQDLPIVIVSAMADKDNLGILMEQDVAGYISKGSSLEPICIGIANAIHRSILDRSSRALYQAVRKVALPTAWNSAKIISAASAVWRRKSSHDKWRGFWDIWNHQLSAQQIKIPVDALRCYFEDNDLIALGLHPEMRGHLEHVLHVYFTGYVVSHSCKPFREIVMKASQQLLGENYKSTLENEYWSYFQIAWLVCATLHDTGYCMELLPSMQQKIQNLIKPFHFLKTPTFEESWNCSEILWEKVTQCKKTLEEIPLLLRYDSYPTDWIVKNAVYEDPKSGIKRLNHGVVSALLFLSGLHKHCEQLKSENNNLYRFLEWAAVSMAFHSLKYRGRTDGIKLQLQKDPLSTLLLLCDELQIWDRERPDENRESNPFQSVSLTKLEVKDCEILAEVAYTPFPGQFEKSAEAVGKLEEQIEKDKNLLGAYLKLEPLTVSINHRIRGWVDPLSPLTLH